MFCLFLLRFLPFPPARPKKYQGKGHRRRRQRLPKLGNLAKQGILPKLGERRKRGVVWLRRKMLINDPFQMRRRRTNKKGQESRRRMNCQKLRRVRKDEVPLETKKNLDGDSEGRDCGSGFSIGAHRKNSQLLKSALARYVSDTLK